MSKAVQLKDQGNALFKAGNFAGAEAMYSKAIILDPRSQSLYTNRAMTRLRLKMWDSVVSDCRACLALSDDNMKAHFFLSQAELELHDYSEALDHASRALDLCVMANDSSLNNITTQVLKCKKERWAFMEKQRARENTELEGLVISLMEKERDEVLRDIMDEADEREVRNEWQQKIDKMRLVFDKARAAQEQRRTVPEWAVDDISFGIMIDPVITKTGKSYERASLMEHLKRSHTDPLTREELSPEDLRPNLGLRQACEEFLDDNGWAVDW